jgi:hypothetical protein
VAAVVLALLATGADQPLTSDQRVVINHISADSLRGNLSFLASDLLEGRATPSRGLDLAAEYIAAQFRRAGLEAAGDDGYFQTATLADVGDRGKRLAQSMGVDDVSSVKMRNVAGILRGSDPQLRDTYVVLSSHYDHLGIAASGNTSGADRIYNGANDDGSGSSSVIEVANALAALPVHPRRSIIFILFFGEERGLWGSRFYAAHPLVSPAQTIAQLNLEQVGRTDAADGPQIKTASITGYDFSDVPTILADAAKAAGVTVYKNPQNSDAYFSRSDNQSLADLGIPAHTLCVAYDFPDYHKVSDSWEKIDYDNMAAVDRAVALGMMRLASDEAPPKWNEQYAAARRYADAARRLHPKHPALGRSHGFRLVAGNRGLRRRQPRDRNSVRRAGHVVHADPITELDRAGIAAVLAADADCQIRTRLAAQFDAHLDHLPDAFLVDRSERIGFENLQGLILAGELRIVVAG